jgi:hypothetical protein
MGGTAGKAGPYGDARVLCPATPHIEVIRMFLDVTVATREVYPGVWEVKVG